MWVDRRELERKHRHEQHIFSLMNHAAKRRGVFRRYDVFASEVALHTADTGRGGAMGLLHQ